MFMSNKGSKGHIMSESGLRNQCEIVYASKSVNHMLTGHAYAQTLRAHLLSAVIPAGYLNETSDFFLNEEHIANLAAFISCFGKKKQLVHVRNKNLRGYALTKLLDILNDLQQNKVYVA